jgi:putative DNA primase/helicase
VSAPGVIATNFRRLHKGTIVATADLTITGWRITFCGVMWHRRGERELVQIPSREWLRDGVKQYAILVKFVDSQVDKRWQAAAFRVPRRRHPTRGRARPRFRGGSNMTSPLDTALSYRERFGWWLFPCKWQGEQRKHPLTKHGFRDASNDPEQIRLWWCRWPQALLGVATGASGLAVLDVDVKDPKKFGPDSLADLGRSILDDSWIVHTATPGWQGMRGWQVYYDALEADIPSSESKLGLGLDVRGNTGYVIAPSEGSGYRWDELNNRATVSLAAAPGWLIPPAPKPETIASAKPVRPTDGLGAYAEAAIARACLAIRGAANGQQRVTLLKEAFTIGTLCGAGGLPPAFARAALIDAGSSMPNFDPRKPWSAKEIARVVDGAFKAGVGRPRPTSGRRAAR